MHVGLICIFNSQKEAQLVTIPSDLLSMTCIISGPYQLTVKLTCTLISLKNEVSQVRPDKKKNFHSQVVPF